MVNLSAAFLAQPLEYSVEAFVSAYQLRPLCFHHLNLGVIPSFIIAILYIISSVSIADILANWPNNRELFARALLPSLSPFSYFICKESLGIYTEPAYDALLYANSTITLSKIFLFDCPVHQSPDTLSVQSVTKIVCHFCLWSCSNKKKTS